MPEGLGTQRAFGRPLNSRVSSSWYVSTRAALASAQGCRHSALGAAACARLAWEDSSTHARSMGKHEPCAAARTSTPEAHALSQVNTASITSTPSLQHGAAVPAGLALLNVNPPLVSLQGQESLNSTRHIIFPTAASTDEEEAAREHEMYVRTHGSFAAGESEVAAQGAGHQHAGSRCPSCSARVQTSSRLKAMMAVLRSVDKHCLLTASMHVRATPVDVHVLVHLAQTRL